MAEKFLGCLRALFAVLFNRPLRVRVKIGARRSPAYFHPGAGLVLPMISGGSGEGEGGEGAGSGEGEGEGEGAGEGSGSGEGEGGAGEGESGGGDKKTAEEYRKELRQYERNAKTASKKKDKELEELRDKLQKREDAEKSEQEKAVEQARKEARDEALTEAEKTRRSDRLETAVVRTASKKLEVTVGDKKEQKRFDDPADAELFLRKRIDDGQLSEDDLFDDNGKVKTAAVEDALREILEDKPRLAEDFEPPAPKTAGGSADGGKGGEAEGGEDDMNAALRRRR